MIDRAYRQRYRAVFELILAERSPESVYESAILSYVHRNPLMSRLFWQRIDAAVRLAGGLAGKAVLDLGCGAGVTFLSLQQQNSRITGCDAEFVPLAREVARRLGIEVELVGDLAALSDRKFDVVIALDVLEHAEDLDGLMDALRARMSAGAKLIVSGPTETLWYRLGRALSGFKGHSHVRDIYDIEKALAAKGFRRRAVKRLYPPVTLFRVSAWEV